MKNSNILSAKIYIKKDYKLRNLYSLFGVLLMVDTQFLQEYYRQALRLPGIFGLFTHFQDLDKLQKLDKAENRQTRVKVQTRSLEIKLLDFFFRLKGKFKQFFQIELNRFFHIELYSWVTTLTNEGYRSKDFEKYEKTLSDFLTSGVSQ